MKYKKFIALFLCLIVYIGTTYLLFSGILTETYTNKPAGTTKTTGGGLSEPVGISDSLTVVITRVVKYSVYWGFLKLPVRRGDFNMSEYHSWFLNVIFPATLIASIYLQGKQWETEGAIGKI